MTSVIAASVAKRGRPQHVDTIAPAMPECDFDALSLTLRVRPDVADGGAEPDVAGVLRGERLEAPAERLDPLATKYRTPHVVHVNNDAVPVEDDETVLDALDDGLDGVDPTPLDRECGLTGQRLEQLSLLACESRAEPPDVHRKDPDGPADGAEWHVQPFPSRQRLRATARWLIALPGPRRGRTLCCAELDVRGVRSAPHEMTSVRKQDRGCGVKRLCNVRDDRVA